MLPDGSINPGQMTSFNHYALGSVASFLHATVAGLSSLEPGWKCALVKPQPGGTLTWASASFDSPYGLYSVEWHINSDQLEVDFRVPPNGSARVILEGVDEKVGSGRHRRVVSYTADPRWPPKGFAGPQSVLMPDRYVP
jgi:alpha-L-rhamnosidase